MSASLEVHRDDSLSTVSPQSTLSRSSTSPGPSGPSTPEEGSIDAGPSRDSSPSSAAPSGVISGRDRIRTKISLAPGQPPTARGNPRIRVYVACHQCRARKIRCDGAKPICANCHKRFLNPEQCNYDSGPNRRGRQKGTSRANASTSSKKPPLRKRKSLEQVDDQVAVEAGLSGLCTPDPTQSIGTRDSTSPLPAQDDFHLESDLMDLSLHMAWDFDTLTFDESASFLPEQQPWAEDSQDTPPEERCLEEPSIPSRPSIQFARDTWWDALVNFYTTEPEGSAKDSSGAISLNPTKRSAAMKMIMTDLKYLFSTSPCWSCFIHVPRFFDMLFNPVRRHLLQPSVLLAALALGSFTQGSEIDQGARERQKALALMEMAHGALQSALATGSVDDGLAQAALLMVTFELQSHPLQSAERSRSALLLLDSLTRLLSLNFVDENITARGRSPFETLQNTAFNASNPVTQLGPIPQQIGNSRGVYTYGSPSIDLIEFTNALAAKASPSTPSHHKGCECDRYSLGANYPAILQIAPEWKGTIMWPEGLSEADFKREQCRRLMWSAVMVSANLAAYLSAEGDASVTLGQLFVREPENLAVLLPGESLGTVGTIIPSDDIWSLGMRTMLLLHRTMRIREASHLNTLEHAQLAVQAWLEADDIEQRLEKHTCDLDTVYGFQSKEMLFHVRMITSNDFQNFIPQVSSYGPTLFYRSKAEAWLRYIEQVGDWIWQSIQSGNRSRTQEHRKSLTVYWYLTNIKRSLTLWRNDRGLIYALEVARVMAERVEYLMLLWPNMRLRQIWQGVRMRLVEACLSVGIAPPSLALPKIPRPQGKAA